MSRALRFRDTLNHEGRAWEWVVAFNLAMSAFIMAWPGDTLRYGIYAALKRFGIGEPAMTLLFGVVATFIMVALYINGMHRRTPVMRGAGCIAAFVIFGCMFILAMWELFINSYGVKTPGLILAFFFGNAVFACFGIIRAGKDAANVRDH